MRAGAKSSRAGIVAGLVLAAALLGWIAAAPLMTFNALAEAARYGQAARMESMVDFPAVRRNLSEQLTERLTGAIRRDRGLSDSPFGALGALLAPALVQQVVDAVVTPAGISAIVRTGRAPLDTVDPRKTALPPPDAAPPPPASPRPEKPKTRFAYRDLNTFVAVTQAADAGAVGWVLERRNLVQWKLVSIELPQA